MTRNYGAITSKRTLPSIDLDRTSTGIVCAVFGPNTYEANLTAARGAYCNVPATRSPK